MTGLDRLRELSDDMSVQSLWCVIRNGKEERWNTRYGDGMTINGFLRIIADQIEAEQEERITRRAEDREAAEWVREHGGLEKIKRQRMESVPRAAYERRRAKLLGHIRECETALGRRREAIARLVDENDKLRYERAIMRPRLMPEGMKWPRFESGELVQIGDSTSKLDCVDEIKVANNRVVLAQDSADGRDRKIQVVYGGERVKRVKRPAPKVLDADGAEIRVGDEVFVIETGKVHHVAAIDSVGKRFRSMEQMSGDASWLDPMCFTHRAPVLAADGRPLREGETVWNVDGAGPYEVNSISGNLVKTVSGAFINRRYLTHERPDSWERWRKDFLLPPVDYCMEVIGMEACRDMGIEGLDDSFDAQVKDMDRRAKELAERGAR